MSSSFLASLFSTCAKICLIRMSLNRVPTSIATALAVDTARGLKGVTAKATAVALPLPLGYKLRVRAIEDSAIAQ